MDKRKNKEVKKSMSSFLYSAAFGFPIYSFFRFSRFGFLQTGTKCYSLLILPCFQKVQSCRRTDSSSLLHKYCTELVSQLSLLISFTNGKLLKKLPFKRFYKCIFFMSPSVGRMFGRLNGRSVCHNFQKRPGSHTSMLLSEHLFIIGAAPLITLGTTYLDENLDKVTESSKVMAKLKVNVGTGFPLKDAR